MTRVRRGSADNHFSWRGSRFRTQRMSQPTISVESRYCTPGPLYRGLRRLLGRNGPMETLRPLPHPRSIPPDAQPVGSIIPAPGRTCADRPPDGVARTAVTRQSGPRADSPGLAAPAFFLGPGQVRRPGPPGSLAIAIRRLFSARQLCGAVPKRGRPCPGHTRGPWARPPPAPWRAPLPGPANNVRSGIPPAQIVGKVPPCNCDVIAILGPAMDCRGM
jgi:hypothetical protein